MRAFIQRQLDPADRPGEIPIGTPKLLIGDEVRRTQRGNNDADCLDDDTTWFDWSLLARHADVRRFVRLLSSASAWGGMSHGAD